MTIEELEKEKLKSEIRQLNLPPYRKTTFWTFVISTSIAVIGFGITYVNDQSDQIKDLNNQIKIAQEEQKKDY